MSKLFGWVFKSFSTFSLATIGLAGFAFWGYTIYSEGKFNQPIIGQTIKILGKNPQIKDLVGYPLSYRFSLSNKFVQKQNQSYYSFKVNGPKCSTNVEMTVGLQSAGTIYNYGSKQQKIALLQQSIQNQQELIKNIQSEITKAPSKKQKQLILEKSTLQSKLKLQQNQLIQAKYEIVEKKNRFYVPDKELYSIVNNPKNKDNNEIIQKEKMLSGINDLVVTLPNRTKMVIYPEQRKSLTQKEEIIKKYQYPDVPTIAFLQTKTALDVNEFTKDQIEEYGKQKISFMYSKYSSYRFFSMLFFTAGILGIYLYKKTTALSSIKGSILQEQVKKLLNKNHHIINLLSKRNKRQLQFDNLIGGGIANNNFNCVMYIKSLTNGRVQFSGKYLQDLNVYKYDKITLKYREKEKRLQIDLLK